MNRLTELAAKMPVQADCLLITSDINRRYFTGMKSSAGVVAVFRDAQYLLIDSRYYEKASHVVTDCEVILLRDLPDQLNDFIKKHHAKSVMIEARTMTLWEFSIFQKQLKAKVLDSMELSVLIDEMRMVKSPEEIAAITKAQRIAEDAYSELLNFITPGVTEREIALRLDFLMLGKGAEALSFDTIALSGTNTSMPHGVPSEKPVAAGEFVLLDFGAVWEGYHSDMTRTVCVGEPDEQMRGIYEIVLCAQQAGLESICAGITGKTADKAARDVIEQAGYGAYFGHSLGHGVGMEIHEQPNAAPRTRTVFRPGMVVTVEPGIYLPGEFGVRIEDFVCVTETGCENLTKAPKKLLTLPASR